MKLRRRLLVILTSLVHPGALGILRVLCFMPTFGVTRSEAAEIRQAFGMKDWRD